MFRSLTFKNGVIRISPLFNVPENVFLIDIGDYYYNYMYYDVIYLNRYRGRNMWPHTVTVIPISGK